MEVRALMFVSKCVLKCATRQGPSALATGEYMFGGVGELVLPNVTFSVLCCVLFCSLSMP